MLLIVLAYKHDHKIIALDYCLVDTVGWWSRIITALYYFLHHTSFRSIEQYEQYGANNAVEYVIYISIFYNTALTRNLCQKPSQGNEMK